MATQELNVKFKVDASELKKGSNEAKKDVKDAAQQMASDVKNSSQKMEASMKDVSKATEGISDATKTATTAVKQMEGEVSSSAKRMKSELEGVGSTLKGISARQVVGITSRGLGIAGHAAHWAADNFTEEGSTAQQALDVGGSALEGAGQGAMLGGAIGSIIPGLGTAVGAAIGGAVGALAGAAAELWESSKALKESAKERQQAAEQVLQQAGKAAYERERLNGYAQETQELIGGIGQNWRYRSSGEVVSGEERIYREEQNRQSALESAVQARDDYARQHQYDTGTAAENAATQLALLERAVQVAQERLQALAPAVEAARRSDAEKARAAQDAAKAAEREAAARDAAIAKAEEQARKAEETSLKEQQRDAEKTMADYQRELQGIASKPADTPTDQLTRIGGGGGYASYNNSTAQIQKNIESYLKTLVANQKSQIQEIINKLDTLKLETTATFA